MWPVVRASSRASASPVEWLREIACGQSARRWRAPEVRRDAARAPATMRMPRALTMLAVSLLLAACAGDHGRAAREVAIVVFNAGSLGRPLRAALDTFAAREHVRVEQENAG